MRLLAVHADSLSFESGGPASEDEPAARDDGPEARDDGPEARDDAPSAGALAECVAAFVAVERSDRAALDAVAADAAAELDAMADRLGATRVALVPDEHLVDDPASASVTAATLRALAARLDDGREMLRAPVGPHLAVDCRRKGHPFAERSIRINPRRKGGDTEGGDTGGGDGSASASAAATVDALAELGLAATEPAADGDAVRWLPRGQFLRDAVCEYAEGLIAGRPATRVSTPAIDVHAAADRRRDAEDERGSGGEGDADAGRGNADATDPIVGPADRDQILRPERHGGLLAALADAAAEDSFVRIAETTRRTPDGAANVDAGPFGERVRPEYHAAVPDEATAIDEFERFAAVTADAAAALGGTATGGAATPTLELDPAFRDRHPAFADRIVDALGDALGGALAVETRPGDERYWAARLSFDLAGETGGPSRLGSVELDAATPTRFGIERPDGGTPVLVHAAPVGDVDAAVAALAVRAAAGERSGLPVWLTPTQVRLVPIDGRHDEFCDGVTAELRTAGVRADVDAREATVGARLARAERERVPHVAVVGDREVEGGALRVANRETGREEATTVDALRERVLENAGDRRRRAAALPQRVGEYTADGP